MKQHFSDCAQQLVEAGQRLHHQGWVPATSGNFSARVDDALLAITVSGRHKGQLTTDDIMGIDYSGKPLDSAQRSSAETLLHTQLYQHFPDVQAVLHTHSVNATLLSRLSQQPLVFEDYELLKAFSGIETHESSITVPVFDNDQDIPRLAGKVAEYLAVNDKVYGYLIAGHGLYTWGGSVAETLRHLEAFEFLFQCELTLRGLKQ